MKISVSSYSFQQAIRNGLFSQEDTVTEAHKLGFSGIEFTELMPCENPTLRQQLESAGRIKKKAAELGMDIVNYAISANMCCDTEEEQEAEIERVKKQVLVAKELGAPVMRHDVCFNFSKRGRSFDLMLPIIAENVRKIAEFAMEHGVKTCSENHGFIAQDSDRVERLFNAVNHPNYGLLVDMGNFLCADEAPAMAVSRVAPYAFHAHAKDFVILGTDADEGIMTRAANHIRGTIVGNGDVPVKKCLKILKKAGYDGYLSIEFEGPEECISAISEGKKNLEGFLAEI